MPLETKTPLLKVENLQAWYAESQALHGVGFEVQQGELVTLIGRNGAGKSTTLRSIMGIVRNRKGSITFEGQELIGLRTYQIARKGIAWCPEERGIFSDLTVKENLTLPPHLMKGGMTDEALFASFPNLKARASSGGTQLSGGEQQMLAIARILRNGCRFLLLDEPSEGLAPVIVKEIGNQIRRLKSQGYTILLVEQNVKFARAIADRRVVIEHGKVVDQGTDDELAVNVDRVKSYLGV